MEFLYWDSDIAVCIKPVGLDAEQELPEAIARELGGPVFPIHRLDKNVGGCMVYARTKQAAARLNKAVQEGTMVKEYVALVHGTPPQQGDWQDLLWKDSRKNKVFVVTRERKGVKPARLEFTRLTEEAPCLVRIRLHTGRSHQIRVQFASRGYPLVGDHKYGARDDSTAPMLFSCALTFPHLGKQMHFEALPHWAAGGQCPRTMPHLDWQSSLPQYPPGRAVPADNAALRLAVIVTPISARYRFGSV